MAGDMMKGGLRYKRIKKALPGLLAPEHLDAFFIAVIGEGGLSDFMARQGHHGVKGLRVREFVVAATNKSLVVLPITGVGTFSAKLGDPIVQTPLDSAATSWDGETLTIDGQPFGPIAFHKEDALAVQKCVDNAATT
jgi:hypothetical protein